MKWREKLHNMALIDLLYLIDDNCRKVMIDPYDEWDRVCARKIIVGNKDCDDLSDISCKECLMKLLNEEVK